MNYKKQSEQQQLVSIIVPVYNAEHVLTRCIKSLLNQTYYELEVVVIDDGSTDKSAEILDEIAQNEPRIKVYHIDNGGVSEARNFGISVATGEYISFVDADDIVAPQYIERLLEVLLLTGTDVSTCCAKDVLESKVKQEWEISLTQPSVLAIEPKTSFEQLFDYALPNSHRVVWGAIYRKSIIQGIQFSNKLQVGEDTLFFAHVLKNARRVSFVGEPLYCYVQYEESAAHGVLNQKKFSEIEARKQVCELFEDENKRFLYEARASLAMIAKKFLTEMKKQNYNDNEMYRKNIGLLRKNIVPVLFSAYSLNAKIALFLCSVVPNLYLYIMGIIKR